MPAIKDIARIRTFEGQKAGIRRAVGLLCSALRYPGDAFRCLSSVGVTFTRRQLFIIKILSIRPVWAQRFMLWLMRA